MAKKYVAIFNDPAGGAGRALVLEQAADKSFTVQGITDPGNAALKGVIMPGLILANTTGVLDSSNKRFLTNALLASLVTLGPLGVAAIATQLAKAGDKTGVISLLASVAAVDLNVDPATPLYTVPDGKSAVITHVVLRLASINLTTASISLGFTGATYLDVIANATHTALTGNTLMERVPAKVGALVGVAGAILKVICNTKQGAAATCTIDVYGYLF